MRFGEPWSDGELDFLIHHWNQPGWNAQRIADEKPGPKRSMAACQQRAHYLGLTARENSHKPSYAEMYPVVQILAARDMTREEIVDALAERFGVRPSGPWVINVLRQHHPYTYRKWLEQAAQRRARGIAKSRRRKAS